MATQIQLRRDLAANWTAANPVLAQGEEGLELDTGKRKVGDGATQWTGLPYDSEGNPVIAIADGVGSTVSNGIVQFNNANGVSFGFVGSVMTASVIPNLNFYANSQTVGQSSSSAIPGNAISLVGAGNISVGFSLGSVIISGSGGGGGVALSAGANSTNTGTVVFSNSNGVSFGMNGGGIVTASVAGAGAAGSISAGTTSMILGQAVFSNANGVSFGLAGSTLTASVANQSLGIYALSNTTQGTSGTVDARSLSFQGAGAASVGYSNGSVVISVAVGGQSNQTVGFYGVGNTTQNSSTTLDARTVSLHGLGALSVGYSNGSVQLSVPNTLSYVGTNGISVSLNGSTVSVSGLGVNFSAGTTSNAMTGVVFSNSNGLSFGINGSTITASGAQQTGLSGIIVSNTTYTSGTISLVNANGISFGSSGANGISASYSVPTQSNQTEGRYALGNTTGQSSSSTFDARTLSLSGAGIVSVGFSNNALQISASQSVQSIGAFAVSNTTQGSSGTIDARSLTFQGAGAVSVGYSNGSVVISAAAGAQSVQTVGVYGISNTTGAASSTTVDARSLSFQGAGAVSVGMSNGSVVISAAAGAQSVQTLGLYGLGNTTQNSSTTFDARSLSLNGLGIVTVGYSNGSIQISATTAAQSVQSVGIYGGSNTTGQSSSSTVDARSFSINGAGGVSVGMSGGTLIVSGQTTFPTLTAGLSNLGNTLGTSGVVSNQLVFAGGANITLSGSVNGGSATITVIGAAATLAQGSISAGTTSAALGQVVFSNSNGISFGLNGQTLTANYTVPSQSAQTEGLYAIGNTTGQSSSSTFDARTQSIRGAGIVSVGYSASALVISAAQSVQTEGGYAVGNTTQGTSASFDARSMSVMGAGAVSVGWSNSSLVISAAAGAQSVQSLGVYGISQTTGASSSSTYDARSLSIVGAGIISVGQSAGQIIISAPGTTGLTMLSAGMSNGGNTAGTSGLASNQLVVYGGANITLSQSVNGGSATLSIIGGAGGGGGGGVNFGLSTGGNTAGATGTVSTGNVVLVGVGAISLSQSRGAAGSGATISILAPATSSLVGAGGITISTNGSTITISGGGVGSGGTISAGTTNFALGQLVFSNGSGVSFGINGSTLTASVAAQSNQSMGLYALGNTTQNSSTVLDARSVSLNGLGAMSVGFTNGSVQLSVPATSSLVGTSGISVSTNGNTIYVYPNPSYASFYDPDGPGAGISYEPSGQNSLCLRNMQGLPSALSVSRFDVPASISMPGTLTSISQAFTIQVGIYTRNGSTLSLLVSGSQSYAVTQNSTNGSTSNLIGLKHFSVPVAFSASAVGDYWFGFLSSMANTGVSSSLLFPQVGFVTGLQADPNGLFGSASNVSNQFLPGRGAYSVSTGALPASVAFSQLLGQAGAINFRAMNMTA